MNYVIIGNSAAGIFAAEGIREADPQGTITVLTADHYPSYSRCLTTYYLAGDIEEEQIFLRTPEELAKLNLDIHYGCRVTGLNSEQQRVSTADGRSFEYDRCLIATGASAVTLDLPGASLPEVFTLRHLENAKGIRALLKPGGKAVIIGGGLVSLKSAYALSKQGLEVHVVVSSGYILSQMLNPLAAQRLEQHLRDHGIDIILNSDVAAIEGQDHVEGVRLKCGQRLKADLVIIGKGVRPNTEPFLNTGLKLKHGIVVDDYLETNLSHVYAAGDVAEAWDYLREGPRINAVWPNATEQGRIAALNMTGKKTFYKGSMGMNSVDFFGLRIISAGIIKPPQRKEGFEDTLTWQVNEDSYQSLIWQGDYLKGYVLIGHPEQAGILSALIQAREPLSPAIRQHIRAGKRAQVRFVL
ncbi:NAD(P)H-nitrite reductase [Desulfitobacterium dichloroeliminans LMG P-21439]|uniref:NAD(P)H-nitrite reductase n=1 Tax=Desulfitobacterium dichloroeliminans (strain LMG P-21439 / DCA1) TaxID=871963 RepID=L0F578_DESDL|nr:FAD-dependent oxidoreductase [Desulfitobacterium dichloroeliminans]AGA68185.1 NAD(P)H-nitrite reductase [Desulfitobacterium dichloroeliminans LMG P-21439]